MAFFLVSEGPNRGTHTPRDCSAAYNLVGILIFVLDKYLEYSLLQRHFVSMRDIPAVWSPRLDYM